MWINLYYRLQYKKPRFSCWPGYKSQWTLMEMTGQRRLALLPGRLSEWRGSSHYRTGAPLIPRPLVRNEARGQPVNRTLEDSWTVHVLFLHFTWTTILMFGFLARLSDTWTTPSSSSTWPVSAFMTMSRLLPGCKTGIYSFYAACYIVFPAGVKMF